MDDEGPQYNVNIAPEQWALIEYMEELSDWYYSAGWVMGLEFRLWERLERKHPAGSLLQPEHEAKLRELAAKAGGWAVTPEDSDGSCYDCNYFGKFVPTAEWQAIWAKERAKHAKP